MTDDYANSASTTGIIPSEGTIRGNIETTGDSDWFAVSLTAGSLYQFDLEGSETGAGTLLRPWLQLRNAVGTLSWNDTHNGFDGFGPGESARLTFAPTVSGTYYLVGSGAFNDIGTYQLSSTIISTSFVDDYSYHTDTTGALEVGGSTTGNIETAGDSDAFRITLTAGTTYQFDLEGARSGEGTLLKPSLVLIATDFAHVDAGPIMIEDSGTGWNERLTYIAPVTGTYYLRSASSSGAGTYKLSASIVSTTLADDYLGSALTGALLPAEGALTGSIESSGDTDWFRVTLTAGTTYRFAIEDAATGDPDPKFAHINLRDGGGALLHGGESIVYTAEATGDHFLSVLGNAIDFGTYRVSSAVVSTSPIDDYGHSAPNLGALAVGGSVTGVIETTGDSDRFVVALTQGVTYQFDLEGSHTGQGTLLRPSFDVYRSTINPVWSSTGGGAEGEGPGSSARIIFTAPETGNYAVVSASSSLSNPLGSYRLSATVFSTTLKDDYSEGRWIPFQVPGQPPIPMTLGVVAVNGSARGDLETNDDADSFTIDLIVGRTYRFDLQGSDTGRGTLERAELELYDRTNNLLLSDYGSALDFSGPGLNQRFIYTATESETYFLTVRDGRIGTYELSATELSPDPSVPFDLDGDGTGDVVFHSSTTGELLVGKMLDGDFGGWRAITGPTGPGDFKVIGSGDVNPGLTGGAEVFIQQASNGSIFYVSLDAGATTWGVVSTALTADWKLRDAADVTDDGAADAIVQNATTGEILLADMAGGEFRGWGVVNQNITGEWIAVGAGDLNGDGFADVVVQQRSTGATLFADMADGNFSGWGVVSTALTQDWQVRAVADVTGDGIADVIFQNLAGDGFPPGTTLFADVSTGAVQWGVVTASVTADWIVQGTADVDNDGFADVLFQHAPDGATLYADMGPAGFEGWGVVTTAITSEWQVV